MLTATLMHDGESLFFTSVKPVTRQRNQASARKTSSTKRLPGRPALETLCQLAPNEKPSSRNRKRGQPSRRSRCRAVAEPKSTENPVTSANSERCRATVFASPPTSCSGTVTLGLELKSLLVARKKKTFSKTLQLAKVFRTRRSRRPRRGFPCRVARTKFC